MAAIEAFLLWWPGCPDGRPEAWLLKPGIAGDSRLRGGEKHEDENLLGGGEWEGPFLAAELGVPLQELRGELGALDLQHGQESRVGDV